MLIDAWGIAWPLVHVRPESEIYPVSACVEFLKKTRVDQMRVLDVDAPGTTNNPLGDGAPMAMIEGLSAVRGYSPLDVMRFKEYLQFVTDKDEPLRPLSNNDPLTFPVMSGFPSSRSPIRNRKLLDLLGVAYRLHPRSEFLPHDDKWVRIHWVEQDSSAAFDFAEGGVRELPPYDVSINQNETPRVFVVPCWEELPARSEVLNALKSADLRSTVLLESRGELPPSGCAGGDASASFAEYRPNRVRIKATAASNGSFLVLTDPWYPGWECRVDGTSTPVYRADYLFRAVPLSEGEHEVEFVFRPASFRWGGIITASAALLAVTVVVISFLIGRRAITR